MSKANKPDLLRLSWGYDAGGRLEVIDVAQCYGMSQGGINHLLAAHASSQQPLYIKPEAAPAFGISIEVDEPEVAEEEPVEVAAEEEPVKKPVRRRKKTTA